MVKAVTKKQAPKRTQSIPKSLPGLDTGAVQHAKMLYDPCDSMLEESVYPGDRGYVQRFVGGGVYGAGATANCWFAVIKPGNQCSTNFDNNNPSLGSPLAFSRAAYPGGAFLTANTSKARAVAFCITVRPIASANNATGTIHFGITSAENFRNGNTISPDIVSSYCTNSVSAAQALINPLEIKWCPGGFDDRYAPNNAISDDDSDRNVLIICGIGFPVASGVQYRMTGITEWAPSGLSGIVQDATSVGKSRNTTADVVRALKQKDPNWWWQLGGKTLKFGRSVIGGYAAGGAIGALGAAVRYF